jgi:GT2 family glycosyltransferase/glycosyltransferase involved in cell wall biosynthesis
MVSAVRPNIYEVRLNAPSRLNVYRDRLDGDALERFTAAFEALRDEQGIVDAVCLVQLPFWRPLPARLRDRFGWKIVYDCLDRHGGFSTNSAAVIAEEEALIQSSDLVTATSRVLYEDLKTRNVQSLLLPNAADFDHFSVFVGEAPVWLEQLQKPVIGYYGAIADWFDTALVGRIARLRPQWSVVLVGSTYSADLRPLTGLPNVHLPGEQPYEILPAYLHAFDACIIPFKKSPLTEATNPVKFYEYLCAGKPVVSVMLPELRPHEPQGLVYLADEAEDFVSQIERALAEDSPGRVRLRTQFAERNTWETRYARLHRAVRFGHPMASIIIPTHENLHLTRLCLDGILRSTSWPNYEIIVVDNASTDGTPAYLHDLAAHDPNLRCLFNERNEGFVRAVNQGLTAAAGDYLVLLNNDTIVTHGWLGTMIRHLEQHPDVGMVGPATNLAGNEAKINATYLNIDQMEAFAGQYTRAHAGQTRELLTLGFFCAVIPRPVLSKVGLLDERFGVGMFEDDDLSLRIRLAGYRLLCVDDAFVHHFHSATFKRFGEREYLKVFDANRAKFEQKWSIRWTPHRYRWHH